MVNIVLDLWFCVPCATYDGRCVAEIKGSKLVLNRNVKATLLLLHLLTWTQVFIHALDSFTHMVSAHDGKVL